MGDGFDLGVLVEDGLNLGGEVLEGTHDGFAFYYGQVTGAADLQAHQNLSEYLRCVGLGGGHGDFWAGVQVNAAVDLAGHGGAHHVD